MWLYLPKTTSAYSPASADSIWPSDSLCQKLTVSAMWRQKFLQPRTWRLVLRKAPLMMRLSGLMCEPSTAERGVASWMEWLRASRVLTTPLPESGRESSASTATSGMTSAELLATFDPTGCIWRMSQESLFHTESSGGYGTVTNEAGRLMSSLPDSGLFLETWPRWGSLRNGRVYRQPKPALRIAAKESSSWPTARAEDSESCGNHPNAQDSLGGASRNWTTPRGTDAKCGTEYTDDMTGKDLAKDATAFWKTPHGMSGMDASGKRGGPGGGEFAKQANNWTTPQAHDSAGGNPDRVRRKGTEHGCANLADDVTLWPTPDASASSGGRMSADPMAKTRPNGTKKAITINDAAQAWKADD